MRGRAERTTEAQACLRIHAKRYPKCLEDFFSSGSRLAWIIHPDEEFVEVCHSPTQRHIIGSGGLLDGEQVLPGVQFPIADLFKPWDWE